MENREQQILSEIKVMVASIRTQLQQLDSKMMELQMAVDPNNLQAKPIDIDMDDMDMIGMPLTTAVQDDLPFVDTLDDVEFAESESVVEAEAEAEALVEAEPLVESVAEVVETPVETSEDAPVEETAESTAEEEKPLVEDLPVLGAVALAGIAASTTATAATTVADDLPAVESITEPISEVIAEQTTEPVVESIDDPAVELVTETVIETEVEPTPTAPTTEPDDDDMPLFAEPQPLFEAALNSPKAKKAVIDVMTDKQAWRTDMAGSPVRDLLSAISLNDRVHFIKTLFRDDAVLFQQTRAKINQMSSLDEVVEYITSNFDWDMSSQSVYRFMMAVRRKVQA